MQDVWNTSPSNYRNLPVHPSLSVGVLALIFQGTCFAGNSEPGPIGSSTTSMSWSERLLGSSHRHNERRTHSKASERASSTLDGRIVGISDGDTLTLLDSHDQQHRIRLMGIDAPEKAQAFGQRSKAALSSAVFGRSVHAVCQEQDRYGRSVCKVLAAGLDVNLGMVEQGLAWHYKAYAKTQSVADRDLYSLAQERAQRDRRGLWKDERPTPPWDFRRTRQMAADGTH